MLKIAQVETRLTSLVVSALYTVQLMHLVSQALKLHATFAWTDSTIVLSWLKGNRRRFESFVGDHISKIVDLIPPNYRTLLL